MLAEREPVSYLILHRKEIVAFLHKNGFLKKKEAGQNPAEVSQAKSNYQILRALVTKIKFINYRGYGRSGD